MVWRQVLFECSLRCRYTMRGHTESVNAVQFLPYSNILITCSADKTVSIWDARTVSCLSSLFSRPVNVMKHFGTQILDVFENCQVATLVCATPKLTNRCKTKLKQKTAWTKIQLWFWPAVSWKFRKGFMETTVANMSKPGNVPVLVPGQDKMRRLRNGISLCWKEH